MSLQIDCRICRLRHIWGLRILLGKRDSLGLGVEHLAAQLSCQAPVHEICPGAAPKTFAVSKLIARHCMHHSLCKKNSTRNERGTLKAFVQARVLAVHEACNFCCCKEHMASCHVYFLMLHFAVKDVRKKRRHCAKEARVPGRGYAMQLPRMRAWPVI